MEFILKYLQQDNKSSERNDIIYSSNTVLS